MLISELSNVSSFPIWGYILLVIGALVLTPIVFFILGALEGGSSGMDSKIFLWVVAIITLAVAVILPIVAGGMSENSDRYGNFSEQLKKDYGLQAPEEGKTLMNEETQGGKIAGVSFHAILEGNEFLATDANGERVFVKAQQRGDYLAIIVDGVDLKPISQ